MDTILCNSRDVKVVIEFLFSNFLFCLALQSTYYYILVLYL